MNLELLNKKIEESIISKSGIAAAMKISRQGLFNKLIGTTEFTVSEMNCIAEVLSLTAEERYRIFFADYVDKSANKKAPN